MTSGRRIPLRGRVHAQACPSLVNSQALWEIDADKLDSDPIHHDHRSPGEIFQYDAVSGTTPVVLEAADDTDVVILKAFQDDTQSKTTSPVSISTMQFRNGRTASPFSPAASPIRKESLEPSFESTPLMNMAHMDGRDHHIIYYYKNFVHRHLAQVHRDSLGTLLETGASTAPEVFERQAAAFMPVSNVEDQRK